MKRLWLLCFAAALLFTGCHHYASKQVPLNDPKDQPYCQKSGDMAVGVDPYMVKDKTILVFGADLRRHKVLALNVSMLADPGAKYTVKKSDITATDEFGNKYAPMEAAGEKSERFGCEEHKDKEMAGHCYTEMPDVVNVSDKLEQHFLFFDMKPNHANARRFAIDIPATSASGEKKDFNITVDPMLGQRNAMERWDSYDSRGISGCCGTMASAKPMAAAAANAQPPASSDEAMRAEEAAKRAEEAAKRAEEAAKKGERTFEKSQMK